MRIRVKRGWITVTFIYLYIARLTYTDWCIIPESKNILLHRMYVRNTTFNSQANLYGGPRFQQHHTCLIWTCRLRGYSTTRRDTCWPKSKTFYHAGCLHATQNVIARWTSMVVHDSNATTLAQYGYVCFEDIQPRGDTYVDPKSKNILPHRMFARNSNFNSQVTLYDSPRFQRHHTRLKIGRASCRERVSTDV